MAADQPTTSSPKGDALLRLYLNDHRAGAAAGVALARRSCSRNRGSELGDLLAVIVVEIEEDAAVLERFADGRAVRANRLKQLGARLGERLGRLKLNGQLRGYSPLSRVLELEVLLAGIDAKRSLWLALAGSLGPGRAGAPDFAALAERAEDQRRRMRPHHQAAARLALSSAA